MFGPRLGPVCSQLISLPWRVGFIDTQTRQSPVRLLIVVGTAGVGGTERFVAGLVRHLDAGQFATAICVVDGPGVMSAEYACVAGAVWYLDWKAVHKAAVITAWQEVLLAWRPDVLLLCGFRANMLGRMINAGAVVVNALRSVVLDDSGRPLAHWLDRKTFGRVAVCVSNSQAAIERHVTAGFPPARFQWIANGVDLDRFRAPRRDAVRAKFGLDPDDRVILTVANLRPVKNIPLLLRSAKHLHDRGGVEQVWIVGEGSERPALVDLAGELGLEEVVRFLGAVQDVPDRYAAADVFALSSHFEGMPTVVLEAFAAGLPVVATAVGDVPALCRATGILVPPGDERAMTEALGRVLSDGSLREELRTSARAAGDAFSITAMAGKYASLLLHVASAGRAVAPAPAS